MSAEWHRQAREMKDADPTLTTLELAAQFGKSASAVWKALNPDTMRERNAADRERRRERRRATDRARAERMRSACATCGEPCGVGSGTHPREDQRCQSCISKAAKERADRLVAMYDSGMPMTEMAAQMGITRGCLGEALDRLRKAGRIGYRYAACAKRAAA